MGWDRESLWTKSRLYFERALNTDREDDSFGLWCSMGLELLARSAIAKFSPTLLAEPDKDHKYLLIALDLGSAKISRKSIPTNQVLSLCKTLIPSFTEEELKLASALTGRRNEELHSGTAAFQEYSTQQWIAGFYKCCKILAESQSENLTNLFGDDEAKIAEAVIKDVADEVKTKIQNDIAAYKKVFNEKEEIEKSELKEKAEKQSEIMSHKKHHRVKCPACESAAIVQGDTYGKEQIEHKEGEIVVRQSVIPTQFSCIACGLKLSGYGVLSAPNLGNHFTHRTHYTPEEYYDLIDPHDTETLRSYAEDHGYYHFSND
ncbi:TPA: hypothetical protein F7136_16570 [Legionella pneumophila]|uniref:DUF4145 domain-containing protein n=1 Tax=Legionella waltersii TaxID=66969 RepID=A0A0W1AP03_9GAMM|nr:hypothetical protein [Legionella waltersii]HAU3628993.1 hypothetical protein [Legionella pneumophila]KTD82978.1 hypothetical protein Lwal_0094 [Legionella waltersii]SNV07453.1 Uncharacterised protein [Legionella waltersii]HAU3648713.1 hypothetical protein [Legionella pneumophila]HAU3655098.1 hypothetical protein [Legionella pneumophila]